MSTRYCTKLDKTAGMQCNWFDKERERESKTGIKFQTALTDQLCSGRGFDVFQRAASSE